MHYDLCLGIAADQDLPFLGCDSCDRYKLAEIQTLSKNDLLPFLALLNEIFNSGRGSGYHRV